MGPEGLARILSGLKGGDKTGAGLLAGFEHNDDAAVYSISDELVMVQTVDFFTPIVDDPFLFGRITAANAMSDIYAMGIEPSIVLNIVAFPCDRGLDVLERILAGGAEKIDEAGALIAGGHSVDDPEPKYGLVVTGFSRPGDIYYSSGSRPGDALIITKPLGIGILATAIKGDVVAESDLTEELETAAALNKAARDVFIKYDVSAVTDVTGFGLLGHLFEMCEAGGVSAEIEMSGVPVWDKALDLAREGIMPAGLHDNKSYLADKVESEEAAGSALTDILYDPQTSGGLLIAVAEDSKKALLEELRRNGVVHAAEIGRIKEAGTPLITLI